MDLDGLVAAPPIPIECLEQSILQFVQFDGVAAIDIDGVVAHVVLALAQAAQTRQADPGREEGPHPPRCSGVTAELIGQPIPSRFK